MLFVSILSGKPDLAPEAAQEGLTRRLAWNPPEGVKILGEYWLQEAPARVVVISEAQSAAPLFLINQQWADLFDIEVMPAITAASGESEALPEAAAICPTEAIAQEDGEGSGWRIDQARCIKCDACRELAPDAVRVVDALPVE